MSGSAQEPVAAAGGPEVRRDDARSRYEIVVGGVVAGFSAYRAGPQDGDPMVFLHTEVDDAHSGQGLGTLLARGALDDVRLRGRRIVPLCPFIAAFIRRHPEYQELVESWA
ncbi:GNAT family N-acetyltransferase [Cellulomonas sp. KRMCY2]|uniref:GNAT family N-acetyltransferase n=1 Tax=Cellulomonas sp. KRMCY2 TaxID=1304865 RepID=UPI00045E6925|nr:GNAT family N-acetyltransferase [Cellulomonas sp. KRMCY2]